MCRHCLHNSSQARRRRFGESRFRTEPRIRQTQSAQLAMLRRPEFLWPWKLVNRRKARHRLANLLCPIRRDHQHARRWSTLGSRGDAVFPMMRLWRFHPVNEMHETQFRLPTVSSSAFRRCRFDRSVGIPLVNGRSVTTVHLAVRPVQPVFGVACSPLSGSDADFRWCLTWRDPTAREPPKFGSVSLRQREASLPSMAESPDSSGSQITGCRLVIWLRLGIRWHHQHRTRKH